MEAKAYVASKVWRDGQLMEDVEIFGEGDDDNVKLIVRDKDKLAMGNLPHDQILEAVFRQRESPVLLDQRIEELIIPKTGKATKKSRKQKPRSRSSKRSRRKGRSTRRKARSSRS